MRCLRDSQHDVSDYYAQHVRWHPVNLGEVMAKTVRQAVQAQQRADDEARELFRTVPDRTLFGRRASYLSDA
ncbi:hypothetical protein ANO14919_134800 [Xylariales sp. No.14919]|nr:hypothetical protein ANO14919_134800 [Xylariales sp. No.14919]